MSKRMIVPMTETKIWEKNLKEGQEDFGLYYANKKNDSFSMFSGRN